ncbi:hypothetical protein ACOKLU_002605 [Staphylococcus aureus]|uniref:hypothetical protein n=1 Tax=Staphylococcus aureus TaxID=1280 RepID=UPI00259F1B38|nr:hypothetical protein [Staphylococcus aureus]
MYKTTHERGMGRMSNIYYAKFNVNEDIFKIYKNHKKLSDILEYVLLNMDSKNSYRDEKTNVKYRFYRISKDFKKILYLAGC